MPPGDYRLSAELEFDEALGLDALQLETQVVVFGAGQGGLQTRLLGSIPHVELGWMKNYESSVPQEKRWGAREDRLMMTQLRGYEGRSPHKNAILWYQEQHNQLVEAKGKSGEKLDADGKAGPKTRSELIADYMALDGVTLTPEQGFSIEIKTLGYGMKFPLDDRGQPEQNPEPNQSDRHDRRAEFFFFDEDYGVVPAEGSGDDGDEYLTWLQRARVVAQEDIEGIHSQAKILPITDAHFRTGSAVMLPEGGAPDKDGKAPLTSPGALATILRFNEERPGHKILIAGHTDSLGSNANNDELSLQRANAVHAMLVGERQTKRIRRGVEAALQLHSQPNRVFLYLSSSGHYECAICQEACALPVTDASAEVPP